MLSLVSRCTFLVKSLTHLVCAMSDWTSKTEEVCIRSHPNLLINIEVDNLAGVILPTLLRIPYLIDVSYGLVHDRVIAFAGKEHF